MSASAPSARRSPASSARNVLPVREEVPDFADFGVLAFTTTRAAGDFAWQSAEPAHAVFARWESLRFGLAELGAARLGTAQQVHGARVLVHDGRWEGWLRTAGADGHFSPGRGTAMSVTIADCVPVFIAHPSGAAALLHSGWRGTAARIVERGIALFEEREMRAPDLRVHLGPAICGRCYEVSPDVIHALTGQTADRKAPVDLRAIIATHARDRGVTNITQSRRCTRCDNDRLFSHRAGDAGRQLAVMAAL